MKRINIDKIGESNLLCISYYCNDCNIGEPWVETARIRLNADDSNRDLRNIIENIRSLDSYLRTGNFLAGIVLIKLGYQVESYLDSFNSNPGSISIFDIWFDYNEEKR